MQCSCTVCRTWYNTSYIPNFHFQDLNLHGYDFKNKNPFTSNIITSFVHKNSKIHYRTNLSWVSVPLRHSCVRLSHKQAPWRRWGTADSFHQATWEQVASACGTEETGTLQPHKQSCCAEAEHTDAAMDKTREKQLLPSMLPPYISSSFKQRV